MCIYICVCGVALRLNLRKKYFFVIEKGGESGTKLHLRIMNDRPAGEQKR